MTPVRRLACVIVTLLGWSPSALGQTPPGQPPDSGRPPEAGEVVEDVVVVTASRYEEQLINAPVTMTVIPEAVIERAPSQTLTDLLRNVPGMNAVQTSGRDVHVASRAATGTLVDTLLVLLDGRSLYQDFFGFVMWDFLPVDTAEIEQIEVIRGPASAVWGANAMTGVVNVISKTPRELVGDSFASVRFGQIDRTPEGGDFDSGGQVALNALHAGALDDRLAYKASVGFLTQEPFLRPEGVVPGTGTPYPPFENRGTRQVRGDARADYEFEDGRRRFVLAGGFARTEGIIYTGLGPLDIQRGSTLKYGRALFEVDNRATGGNQLTVQFFVNDLDGESPFLLQRGVDGQPLYFAIENQAYNVEVSNTHVVGTRHLLTYGANFRHNAFDISLAPDGHSRDEGGGYVQDQFILSPRLRLFLGARVDQLGILESPVFSPRTALIIKPASSQSIRLSFNRAFRAPSFFNNYLRTEFLSQVDLGQAGLYTFPSVALGNVGLEAEKLTAYEIGYIAGFGRFTLDAAFYINRTRSTVLFTQTASYTSAAPPPGWPLPLRALDDLVAAGRGLPSEFSYRNFDLVTDRGLEVSLDARVSAAVTAYANYTWQATPEPSGFDISELNLPPTHRINAGISYSAPRFFGSLSASFNDDAFWQDVLDARFHGKTEAYTLVDGSIGVRSRDGLITAALRATNLLNSVSQQHVFGDLIRRTLSGELRIEF